MSENNKDKIKKIKIQILSIRNILFFVIVVFVISGAFKIYSKNKVNNNFKLIETKIMNSADLITQKMAYRGVYTYKAGLDIRIPYITERSHNLIYTAILTAGIDLEKDIKIINSEKEVIVELKHSYIMNRYLEPESLEVYDIRGSLIYYDKEKDVIESQKEVARNLEKIINSEKSSDSVIKEFLENADMKTKEIITALVSDLLGDKKLVFNFIEERSE